MVSAEKKETGEAKVICLQGLTCANCAAKIEAQVQKLEYVGSATMNLVNQTLTVTVPTEESARVVDTVKEIVLRLEPHVKVYPAHEMSHNQHLQAHSGLLKEVIQIGIGATFFAIALLVNFSYPVELGLFIIAYLIIGGEVLFRAGKNILRGQVFDENFLMALATVGAIGIGEFPEAISVMLFYQIGELFQGMAVNRSRRSIKELLDIRPEYANIEQNGRLVQVDPQLIGVNEIIVVKPGERVPLDGVVIEGQSMLDTSALTGESVPRRVESADDVLAGFINLNGLLTVKVSKPFGESAVMKILDMVQNASSRKAQTENFITKFARYYTPAVVISALAIAVIPPLFLPGAIFADWLYRGLIFLVVSCPCALVISIPLGFFGGIGGASRNGILIKGGNYLEALNQVKTVVFDKTGTLTHGVFKVTEIFTVGDVTREELLTYAAQAESNSNHPIAKSILEAYGEPIYIDQNSQYQEITGQGVKTIVDGKEILAGNDLLMQNNCIPYKSVSAAGTVVHLAYSGQYLGYIIINDEIKADAAKSISNLRRLGIERVIMLTGDRQEIAEKVAAELEIDQVYAELLPDEKVAKVEDLVGDRSGKLVFVGDGINDAPVLARADIGVAMGGLGSDAAIEAADIVLMTDEPSRLIDALKIARKTKSIVWQNIVFAMGVKGLVLLLGVSGHATMWEAVFADVGVALIAVLNSLRAIGYTRQKTNIA